MYIGKLGDGSAPDDGIYVLLKEVFDNSIDEFVMGNGREIEVLIKDGIVEVRDYGRGIPLGKVVDCVSKINTGGKYDSKAFKKAVGLNGVGTKAVNALSEFFLVSSFREGKEKTAEFSQGKMTTDKKIGKSKEVNGTLIRFKPDSALFKNYRFVNEYVENLLWNYAYLNSGLKIRFNGKTLHSKNGLKDLLERKNQSEHFRYPIIHIKGDDIELAITHGQQYGEQYYSFVNGQFTTQGGTHLNAFKEVYVKTIRGHFGKNFDTKDVRSSSALLEVLDPEQNKEFHDNYLDIEYDLSKVMFIVTANSIGSIQPALRDRMEMIHISGYSLEEKLEIAKRHIILKEVKEHGLKKSQIKIPVAVLRKLISSYTREAGVRALRQKIASLMRYAAKEIAMNDAKSVAITLDMMSDILGPEPFPRDIYNETLPVGVAVGLAWTSVGGEILFIEASKNPGAGKLTLTENLGNVMKESATTALSFIKAHSKELKLDDEIFRTTDLHIHVPEGAIPKDGPSAGITMLTAITSSLLGKPIKKHLAMTGEITLRGKVLPVGGIKEKILAAKRANMKEIMLCKANQKHVEQIDKAYIKGLKFHYVERMEEVLQIALGIRK